MWWMVRRIKQAWLAAELVFIGLSRGHAQVLVRSLDGDEGRPDVIWLNHLQAAAEWGSLINQRSLFKTQCMQCEKWYEIERNHAGVVPHFCVPTKRKGKIDQ